MPHPSSSRCRTPSECVSRPEARPCDWMTRDADVGCGWAENPAASVAGRDAWPDRGAQSSRNGGRQPSLVARTCSSPTSAGLTCDGITSEGDLRGATLGCPWREANAIAHVRCPKC